MRCRAGRDFLRMATVFQEGCKGPSQGTETMIATKGGRARKKGPPKDASQPEREGAGIRSTVFPGGIHADAIYTLRDFYRRTGFTKDTIRAAKRSGLDVIDFGKLNFIDGVDFIRFMREWKEKRRRPASGRGETE